MYLRTIIKQKESLEVPRQDQREHTNVKISLSSIIMVRNVKRKIIGAEEYTSLGYCHYIDDATGKANGVLLEMNEFIDLISMVRITTSNPFTKSTGLAVFYNKDDVNLSKEIDVVGSNAMIIRIKDITQLGSSVVFHNLIITKSGVSTVSKTCLEENRTIYQLITDENTIDANELFSTVRAMEYMYRFILTHEKTTKDMAETIGYNYIHTLNTISYFGYSKKSLKGQGLIEKLKEITDIMNILTNNNQECSVYITAAIDNITSLVTRLVSDDRPVIDRISNCTSKGYSVEESAIVANLYNRISQCNKLLKNTDDDNTLVSDIFVASEVGDTNISDRFNFIQLGKAIPDNMNNQHIEVLKRIYYASHWYNDFYISSIEEFDLLAIHLSSIK